jgi:hypothetical protein
VHTRERICRADGRFQLDSWNRCSSTGKLNTYRVGRRE